MEVSLLGPMMSRVKPDGGEFGEHGSGIDRRCCHHSVAAWSTATEATPMRHRTHADSKNRAAQQNNRVVARSEKRQAVTLGTRARGVVSGKLGPCVPPEDWYEPSKDPSVGELAVDYRIVRQDPGAGYEHVVTPDEIRARLAELPASLLQSLEVIQLSRITRKKKTFPCYGMQWGNALYLYPIEEDLVEYFGRPPLPAQRREAAMFGGRWQTEKDGSWRLIWTPETIRDYYLNNILIHELGHLVDNRNTGYTDRERFADWFAIHYGYNATRSSRGKARPARKRHHRG